MRRAARFPCFDGLRAIAALSVLLYHSAYVGGFSARSAAGVYTSHLDVGVAVFFLISGFLLYRPFVVAHLNGIAGPALRTFWWRRLLRILPAYWLALTVVSYVMHSPELPHGWLPFVTHYALIQNYFPVLSLEGPLTGISQAWTLCIEMSFYLLLPLYAALIARKGGTLRRELWGLGVLAGAGLVIQAWVSSHLDMCVTSCSAGVFPLARLWLPYYLDLFAAGMFLAVLSAANHSLSLRPGLSWLGALVAFFFAAHVAGPSTLDQVAYRQLYGLCAFLLLLPAVFGPQDRGGVRRFLTSPALQFLGVISYGIYLWHLAWIYSFVRWTEQPWASPVRYGLLTVMTLIVTVSVAATSYFGMERWLVSRGRNRRASPAQSSGNPS